MAIESPVPITDKRLQLMTPRVPTFQESLESLANSSLSPAAKMLTRMTMEKGSVRMIDFGKGQEPVLRVSSFFNQVVDPRLTGVLRQEMAGFLSIQNPDCVVTVATSGIYFAQPVSQVLNRPMIVVTKSNAVTNADPVSADSRSFTGNNSTSVTVDRSCISENGFKTAGFVDDFLARADTVGAALDLMTKSNVEIVNLSFPFIKMFDVGYQRLLDRGIRPHRIHGVVKILELTPDGMAIEGVDRRLKFSDRPIIQTPSGNVWQNRPGN